MDPEEVRRLETLIPGTDQETEEDLRYVRRPRRAGAPAPDLPPQELARTYGKGLKGLRVRSLLVFLLAAAALVPCLLPSLPVSLPPELAVGYPLLLWISAGLLGAGMLLSLDVLAAGLWRGVRLKVGMDTLAALSCAFTLADTLLLAGSQDRGGAALLLSRRPVRSVLPAPRHLSQAVRPSPVLPHRSGRRGAPIWSLWTRASGTGRTPTPSGPAPPPALAARSRWTTAPSASTGCSVPSCCWPA